MIHTLNHKGLHSETYPVCTESQRRVLARQLWRERGRGFIISPIIKHKSFAVIRKGDLQGIKRIDVSEGLCFGAGNRQKLSLSPHTVKLPHKEEFVEFAKQYSIS